jgi:hypothetical protein
MTLEFRRTAAVSGYRAGQVTRTKFRESRSISDVTPRMYTHLLLKTAVEDFHNSYCSQNIISLLNRRMMG